jgi:hypothetical protein
MSEAEKALEKGDKTTRKAKEAMPCGDKKGAVAEAVFVEKATTAEQKAW